jgi:hypothetical protein
MTNRILKSIAALLAVVQAILPARPAWAVVDVDANVINNFHVAWDGTGASTYLVPCASGDLSGDGINDLVMVEGNADTQGRSNNGAVYVVYGPISGQATVKPIATTFNTRIDGAATNDTLGVHNNAPGCHVFDLNNDGQLDLALAATGSGSNSGAVYGVYGPLPSGTANVLDMADTSHFNLKVTRPSGTADLMYPSMADLNGDNIDDLFLELPLDDIGSGNSGSIYVLYGPTPSGTGNVRNLATSTHYNLRINGGGSSDFLSATDGGTANNGYPSFSVGDLDANGTPDLAVAVERADTQGRTDNGAFYVSTGPFPSGTGNNWTVTSSTWMVRYDGVTTSDYATRSVIADFNNDGKNDLCLNWDSANTQSRSDNGTVYCVLGPLAYSQGSVRDMNTSANWNTRFDGASAGDLIGLARLRAADLNNDGVKDLLIESDWISNNNSDDGAMYVINGGSGWPTGTGNTKDFSVASNYNTVIYDGTPTSVNEHVGASPTIVKDMDGDGVLDVVITGHWQTTTCNTTYGARLAIFYGPTGSGTGISRSVGSDSQLRFYYNTNYCGLFYNYSDDLPDLDRDGQPDLVMSYDRYDAGSYTDSGRVFFVSIATVAARVSSPSLFTNSTSPTVAWSSVSGASSYRLQVDDDPLFLSPVYDQTVGATNASVSGLTNGSSYYARVKATNGNFQQWGPVANFTIDTTPPTAPVLLTPGDASETHPSVSTQTPTFDWTDASAE